jgi:hypothetical protein
MFERRNQMLRPEKRHTMEEWHQALNRAKQLGIETSMLYVLGLDSLESLDNFGGFLPHLTRFPIVNLFQIYVPGQEELRSPDAHSMEYYLNARRRIEDIFRGTSLKPRVWENYRPLWYTEFRGEKLDGIKI